MSGQKETVEDQPNLAAIFKKNGRFFAGTGHDTHESRHDTHESRHDMHESRHDMHESRHDMHTSRHETHESCHETHESCHETHALRHEMHVSRRDMIVSSPIFRVCRGETGRLCRVNTTRAGPKTGCRSLILEPRRFVPHIPADTNGPSGGTPVTAGLQAIDGRRFTRM